MDIFHYCNLSKFEGILESKKLWLTPVQTMNDGTEVDHLYKVIYPKVKEKIITETPPHLLDDIQMQFGLIESSSELRSQNMPFCTCFSDDGDLLPQWRSYADDGTGVSIGFDSDYFKIQNHPPHPHINIKNSIGLESAIYDYNLQHLILYNVIKQELSGGTQNPIGWLTVLKNLTLFSAIFKNRSFRAEQEKRIIYYFYDKHISQFDNDFLSGPHNYKDGYSRFDLSWFNSAPNHAITKIFIGPKCKQSAHEILKMLEKFNIKIAENQIIKSESSYR